MTASSPRFTISSAPFIHCGHTTARRHLLIMAAALPALVPGILHFGGPAAAVLLLAVGSAMVWELLFQKLFRRPSRAHDGGAALTGLLIAMLMPPAMPWWAVIAATGLAIVLGRELYGGTGAHPFNPVALTTALLLISWPQLYDLDRTFLHHSLDFSAVWPLVEVKAMGAQAAARFSLMDLFLGREIACIGTGCAAGLLLGGLFLMAKGICRFEICLSFILGILLTATAFHLADPARYAGPLFHLLTGSTLFAAFFLMPEDAGSPVLPLPMLLFGLLGGVLVMLIRNIGAYSDGVVFAVLLMNLLTPILDRMRPKALGRSSWEK
ncbi:RnfABCDGE type electron transport complex subunit D [Desulfobotulus sp.]|jgi:electron transport complex protein RnfD|uniref:RnfABCDGE type electron transport complex subunit D n=1 Tax=Desulfobotulus sp. TaxID=1940337 RepID=UPI002A364423|nr:RnfABCDGE type electron transport complex subunit D [Desulfobotulus sp.]MDY0164689.1 RnfABCDGE type electron transport complex subunit D [Desulfobotulus sp.]